jgi:hypothetical protein
MSDLILSGDFTVYYTNDTGGDKQIKWTGSSTGTRTVLELYKEIQNLFDNDTGSVGDHMEEGIPLSTQTPTQFTIGRIEANDSEPWFIDPVTIHHLYGGSLETSGWTYVSNTTNGVFRIPLSSLGTIVAGDVGNSVSTSAGSMTGILIAVDTTRTEIWIRPTSSSSTHDWSTISSGTITEAGSSHTCTQNAAGVTGENVWANIYTLGSISDNTDIYVIQNFAKISAWWPEGQIDILILVQLNDSLIDFGLLTVFARQYTQLYDHYIADVSTGGRNPIPLATSADVNNVNGIETMAISGASGDYTVGEVISNGTNASGVVTAESGSPTTSLDYYLIGDLTDFSASQTITGADSGVTGTSGAPGNGPAILTGVTFTFGATSEDIGDGDGNQPYDVIVGCNNYHIDEIYEYTKVVTRRGSTTTLNDYNGEQYITTGEIRIPYASQTANFLEGATLTGQTSGATGVIVADHDSGTTGTLVVRDVRGTFDDTTPEVIQDDQGTPGSATIVSGGIVSTLVSKTAPFGTFAGGRFFGARGVWLDGLHSDDTNNYELIDSNGTPREAPTSISIAVNGVVAGDRVGVFQATGSSGTVNKAMFTLASGNNLGNNTLVIDTTIPLDTPSSGTVYVVDTGDTSSSTREKQYTYTNFSASTFSGISPTLDRNYDTSDKAYVPYIEEEATGTSVSVSVQFVSVRDVVTVVRRKGILPFRLAGGQITSNGYTAAAIRTADTIVD